MNKSHLLPPEIKLHFAFNRVASLERREKILYFLTRALVVLTAAALLLEWFNPWALDFSNQAWGLILLLLSDYLIIYMTVLFSRYQAGALWRGDHQRAPGMNYLSVALFCGERHFWRELLVRLNLAGVARAELEQLPFTLTVENVSLPFDELVARELGSEPARSVLERAGITLADAQAAAAWIFTIQQEQFLQRAWWRWENLATVPGLAKDWHYGETYHLSQVGNFIEVGSGRPLPSPALESLEQVLNRGREANAVLVGDKNSGLSLVKGLAAKIKNGTVWPHLEGKRILMIDVSRLLAAFEHQPGLPEHLLKLCAEAAAAGNVILGLDDLPRLSAYLTRLGQPLAGLLDNYLAGSALTVIALADQESFHGVVESDAVLMNRLEVIKITSPAEDELINLVGRELYLAEASTGLLFTYQAVQAVAESVRNYFSSGEPSAEAADLISELIPALVKNGTPVVTKELVLSFVKKKTNIPMGEVTTIEREKLLSLEKHLEERVVGQKAALSALAGAIRRARAGTRAGTRPIGTFLFLGPTGVGKTETAKALAQTLFGHEDDLLRLDMSEYSGVDALARLIGSMETGTPGVLSKLAREHPYGVLLLDEFEKTSPQVLNLFLQIFDEGFFSDMSGRRVNVRSLLFIATSNAGAELVWELTEKNESLAKSSSLLTDYLVQNNLFKPELLNRFDAVVIFEPLSETSLQEIARRELAKLAGRLLKQGLTLNITDLLVETLAKRGANRQFGARPLRRLLQDTVEEEVAKAVIAGTVGKGARISFIPSKNPEGNLLDLDLHVE